MRQDLVDQRVAAAHTSAAKEPFSGGQGMGCQKLRVLNRGMAGVFLAREIAHFGAETQ